MAASKKAEGSPSATGSHRGRESMGMEVVLFGLQTLWTPCRQKSGREENTLQAEEEKFLTEKKGSVTEKGRVRWLGRL